MMEYKAMEVILPPARLGILGGGQLGRMFAMAAKQMGYGVVVWDADPKAPAAAFADVHLCVPFDDEAAFLEMAACAAVSTEFENVPADLMCRLAKHTYVSPSGEAVAIAQNRLLEKKTIQAAGLQTAPYLSLESATDLAKDFSPYLPGILKTATLGYDGKGQIRVASSEEVRKAWHELGEVACVLEQKVDLRAEVSVMVCRGDDGAVACYTPAENHHENGILAYSIVPARLPESRLKEAQMIASQLANYLNYVGVLAVELFLVGDEGRWLVNEIAPRPHNSGHHTLDATISSQFEQQVRLMCGLPPAATDLLLPCCMANILGDVWHNGEVAWQVVLQDTLAKLHLYGKQEPRIGRKMGHFTVLSPEGASQAYEAAQALHATLKAT